MLPTSHIKDIDGYIFFSNNTTGVSGRPVKIHSDLFLDFFCAVDPTSHDGLMIIRDIENLKVNPKASQPATSFQPPPARNLSADHSLRLSKIKATVTAMSHRLEMEKECCVATQHIRAYFHVHQKDGDKCPTVYISEIHVAHEGNGLAGGLYEDRQGRMGSSLTPNSKINLEGKTVVASGASKSPEAAMQNAVDLARKEDVVLFFNPPSVANDLGIWRSKRLSEATTKTIDEMTDVLEKNAGKKVSWIVEGEGAAVLFHAIGKVKSTLEKHSFKLVNAKTNIPKLLEDLSKKKAQLSGELINYTRDKTALLAIASQNQELLKQLGGLPGNTGYNQITRRYLKDQIQTLGSSGHANAVLNNNKTLRSSNQTFVDALNVAKRAFR